MGNEGKGKIFAAVAGMIVGAGAAIAGAKALSDRKNQKKIGEVIEKGRSMARNYVADLNNKVEETQEVAEKTVDEGIKKAKKLIKVVKTAEKGVKNL